MSVFNTIATVCHIVFSVLQCSAFESCATDSLNMARSLHHNYRLRSRVVESQPIRRAIDCYVKCMKNCRCLSYNVCNNGKLCELNSEKKENNISLYEQSDECDYHEFTFNRQQSSGCKDQCCSTSQPCQTDVTCEATCMENGKRFQCIDDELPRSCAYYANHESSKVYDEGLRLIYAADNTPYYVFCRWTKTLIWTLVMSYSLENQPHFKQQPLSKDYPVSENSQNWVKYRLSFARMSALRDVTDDFMFTCAYDVQGMQYRDFLTVSIQNLNPLKNSGLNCVRVWKVRVNGNGCDDCVVAIVQGGNSWHMMHHQARECPTGSGVEQVLPYKSCSYGVKSYFGNYDSRCIDEEFSCTSSNKATTQLWFVNTR